MKRVYATQDSDYTEHSLRVEWFEGAEPVLMIGKLGSMRMFNPTPNSERRLLCDWLASYRERFGSLESLGIKETK